MPRNPQEERPETREEALLRSCREANRIGVVPIPEIDNVEIIPGSNNPFYTPSSFSYSYASPEFRPNRNAPRTLDFELTRELVLSTENKICEACGEQQKVNTIATGRNRKAELCERCTAAHFVQCEGCHGYINSGQFECIAIRHGESEPNTHACINCVSSLALQCTHCNSRYSVNSRLPFNRSPTICDHCIDRISGSSELQYRNFELVPSLLSQEKGNTVKSLRPFGVELETVQPRNEADAAKLAKELPIYVGLGSDSSIRDGKGLEVRFPPASGKEGEAMIVNACTALAKRKFKVNPSCGFHVHIDCNQIDAQQSSVQLNLIKSIWLYYLAFEDVIQSFLPFSRRDNEYCQPLRTAYNIDEINAVANMEQLERLWYRLQTQREVSQAKAEHRHISRRRGINLHPLFGERHLEIRYHTGTLNARKILEWANLHCLFVDKALWHTYGADMGYVQKVCNSIDLNWKTKELFNWLNLSQESRGYFAARQIAFLRKIEHGNDTHFKVGMDIINSEKEI